MPHLPTDLVALRRIRTPTPEHPWRILVSGCMTGTLCAWDGSDNGMSGHAVLQQILRHQLVTPVPFCPEHLALGTPRGVPDIHDGDGFDVIDGRAKVLVDSEHDATEALIQHATEMAELGETCDLAILVDVSGTCGSQVIYRGDRVRESIHQAGPAVVAALLWRKHIPFTSQRDHLTLARLLGRLDGSDVPEGPLDHHRHPWVLEHLPGGAWSETERGFSMRSEVSTRRPVFKVFSREVWEARKDTVPWAPIDHKDGFLHLSSSEQLEETLRLYFAEREDLVIVALDPARIPELIWEPSRGRRLFPHAYGSTPLDAVLSVEDRSTL